MRPADKPLLATGGVVGLKGNLAPEGAIVKVAGMKTSEIQRPGALLRRRGSLLRCGEEPQIQGRRSSGDPLRGTARRPRHARNALDHGRALRPGHGRQGRADHRRTFLRRHTRFLRRPCRAGGSDRRPDRADPRRRHHRDRRGERHARTSSFPPTNSPSARASGSRARANSDPVICGNTPSRWVPPSTAR